MATIVKDRDTITADGNYRVQNLIPGREYLVGLFYESGTGTLTLGQADNATSVANAFYNSAETAALTITASLPRFRKVRMSGTNLHIGVSLATSLVGTLRCIPIPHGR